MKRNALVLALATMAFAACGGDESRLPSAVPDPVENEQAIELIHACRVTDVEAAHSGEMRLYLEGGRDVSIADPSRSEEVWDAAAESSERCGIELATE